MEWALVEEILKSQRSVTIQVRGTSMYPEFFTGDWVTIEPISKPSTLREVVLAKTKQEKFLLHRVISLEPEIVLRGDNLNENDSDIIVFLGKVRHHRKTLFSRIRRLKYSLFRE